MHTKRLHFTIGTAKELFLDMSKVMLIKSANITQFLRTIKFLYKDQKCEVTDIKSEYPVAVSHCHSQVYRMLYTVSRLIHSPTYVNLFFLAFDFALILNFSR
jgi:hypothetical protein